MVVLTISSVLVSKKFKARDRSLEKQLENEGIVLGSDINSIVDIESTFSVEAAGEKQYFSQFDDSIK